MAFACFPRLPPELRLKIWKFALPDSRIIELSTNRHLGDLKVKVLGHRKRSPHTLSVLSRICRESYDTMRETYDLQFQPQIHYGVLFNCDIDCLYLSDSNTLSCMAESGCCSTTKPVINGMYPQFVRHLVLPGGIWKFRRAFFCNVLQHFYYLLNRLIGLERITFIGAMEMGSAGMIGAASGWFEGFRTEMKDYAGQMQTHPENYDEFIDGLELAVFKEEADLLRSI